MEGFACVCFVSVCRCRRGLCRDHLNQGGDLFVVVAWISEDWGRYLGEVPLLVPHPGGWGWGECMERGASYLHTWALMYVFV